MSNKRVTRFNVICGNTPSMGTSLEYINQVKNQISRIYEEAKELYEASLEEDFVEILDGYLDVKYTNEYLDDLLIAGGFDTRKAWEEVCNNNDSKFTNSYSYALDSLEHLEEKGVDCWIEETVYEGEIYYTVRRKEDGKVMKLKHHQSPDISKYVPDEFKN